MTEPDLDLLADYAAGVLDGTTGAAVAARIAADPRWAERYAELVAADSTVRADLAALPPVAMPAHVADRLDAVLAAEAGHPDGRTGLDRRRWAGRGAAGRPSGADLVTSRPGPGRGDSTRRWRRRWLTASAGVAAGVALLAAGLVGLQNVADDQITSGAAQDRGEVAGMGQESHPPATASRTDYAPGRLGDQVRALLSEVTTPGRKDTDVHPQESPPTPYADAVAVPPELARFTQPDALTACVAALGAGGTAPLAVDLALYQGTPAVVVVLPAPDPATLTVVAAGPRCGVTGADERDRRTVAR